MIKKTTQSFSCLNCKTIVSEDTIGTKHRNHCPHCLWSKHLDLKIPGDRKSICNAKMKPIGLSFKDFKKNPYTNKANGELMIVHQCLSCGKISSNRIAGDDNPSQIISLLNESRGQNINTDIKLLTLKDKPEVLTTIFGYNYNKSLK